MNGTGHAGPGGDRPGGTAEGMLELPSLLRSDPAAVATMQAEHVPALLAEVAALQAHAAALSNALSLRLLGDACGGTSGRESAERLLSVREAAERLGMSVDWMYRHARQLPFTRRVGTRTVKFDAAGLDRWVAQRRR